MGSTYSDKHAQRNLFSNQPEAYDTSVEDDDSFLNWVIVTDEHESITLKPMVKTKSAWNILGQKIKIFTFPGKFMEGPIFTHITSKGETVDIEN